VAGAVADPVTTSVPVGTSFREVIALAGGAATPDPAILVGGAMMGRLTRDPDEPVTKTTGGLIVLPGDHPLVTRLERPEAARHQIGKSACDQCSYCTELCPRFLLGYAIEPHKVMRSLLFSFTDQGFWSQWGMLCCECGLCTLYACPEDLYPREACQRSKRELRGREFPKPSPGLEGRAHPMYEFRRVPIPSLIQRLGLSDYDRPAPYRDPGAPPGRIRLPLRQGAGAPSEPVVRVGDRVREGDLVAEIPEGKLGARIHAGIPGVVRQVAPEVVIESC
jgi:Na+-translocating ferredoxin:NAD+ oxidoreductase RnfC subunit